MCNDKWLLGFLAHSDGSQTVQYNTESTRYTNIRQPTHNYSSSYSWTSMLLISSTGVIPSGVEALKQKYKVKEYIQDLITYHARQKSLRRRTLYACAFFNSICFNALICCLYTLVYILMWNFICRCTPSRHSSRAWCTYSHLLVVVHNQVDTTMHCCGS